MSDWILVVDDDTSNLRMASRILSGENMRVSCLKSGGEAVRFLQENRPDIILLDVHMPGMDGFETLDAIRSNPETENLPVIMLTSLSEFEHHANATMKGATGYLTKPLVTSQLIETLDKLFE